MSPLQTLDDMGGLQSALVSLTSNISALDPSGEHVSTTRRHPTGTCDPNSRLEAETSKWKSRTKPFVWLAPILAQ